VVRFPFGPSLEAFERAFFYFSHHDDLPTHVQIASHVKGSGCDEASPRFPGVTTASLANVFLVIDRDGAIVELLLFRWMEFAYRCQARRLDMEKCLVEFCIVH